jgi:hypothetical protein
MNPKLRSAVVLSIFAAAFTTLTVSSYVQKSATADEPSHLTAGYTALKLGDYRMDPEHPPFLRMWAALPLLCLPDIKLDTASPHWLAALPGSFAHQFLYRDNDADQLLYRARFMIVLLGVLLGAMLFCWASEFFGFWPAVIVLAFYCLEPNIIAHSGLATTDLGITCFIFGTLYFLWRTTKRVTAGNLAGMTAFLVLAFASKYSAAFLAPVIVVLLTIRLLRKSPWLLGQARTPASRQSKTILAAALALGLAAAAYIGIWAVYGFRYERSGDGAAERFPISQRIRTEAPLTATVMQWVDKHRLLPNTYAYGFALVQAKAQRRQAFLAGQYSSTGWWYFFPVAFLIKTPLALVILALAGLGLCLAQRSAFWENDAFVLAPLAIYLGIAMASSINIGLRHILPIYPFALLLAGKAVMQSWRGILRAVPLALLAATAVEVLAVHPDYLAFFNLAAGGPSHGREWLVDSSLDWGQDLKGLKRWMDKNSVEHINLSYFGNADPDYYGIHCTHLPGAPFFAKDQVQGPWVPGYVAVSATNLRGTYLPEEARTFYWPLLAKRPVAIIGNSIHVYWVDNAWW